MNFYDQFQSLRETGNPFVIATVVRAETTTSTKVGAKAIITQDDYQKIIKLRFQVRRP